MYQQSMKGENVKKIKGGVVKGTRVLALVEWKKGPGVDTSKGGRTKDK